MEILLIGFGIAWALFGVSMLLHEIYVAKRRLARIGTSPQFNELRVVGATHQHPPAA
jgi:hypothetical protein